MTTVILGDLEFDNVLYDGDADVLYLHAGDPAVAVEFDESPEGHALRYDACGHLVGVTIVNASWSASCASGTPGPPRPSAGPATRRSGGRPPS